MKNITGSLVSKVVDAMREAGVHEHNRVYFKADHYRVNGDVYPALFVDGDESRGREFSGDLTAPMIDNVGYYLYGELSCWVTPPSLEDAERFASIVDNKFFYSLRARVETLKSAVDEINI